MIFFKKFSIKKVIFYFVAVLIVFLYNSDKVMFEIPRQLQDKF